MKWRRLLYPLSLPYQLITSVRNWAFERGILPSEDFNLPVIAVGNLSTGGTGKTPMVEFLIRNLKDHNIGLVSRGYGRKTRGLVLAKPEHDFSEIGDEPFQIYRKFPKIRLALAEKRVEGIQALLSENAPELILLDDAFQHRYVKPGFQILLTTYADPYFKDLILPAGNLREATSGRERADLIVVTKCPPTLEQAKAEAMVTKLKAGKGQKVFFSTLSYGQAQNSSGMTLDDFLNKNENQILNVLTGIAKPEPLLEYLSDKYRLGEHLRFPDHHHFSSNELERIRQHLNRGAMITSEKDWVRLQALLEDELLQKVFYQPMEMEILFGQTSEFIKEVGGFIDGFKEP